MNLQLLYQEYLNRKFNIGLPSVHLDDFEYAMTEDDRMELFLANSSDEPFFDWAYELHTKDPNYTMNPDWTPVLADIFKSIDVYDEQIFYYLLFTLNTTTSIVKTNPFNAMNDFMKSYCFFQLTQLTAATRLSAEQKQQLRDFFFFFYLYAHPVNEETLFSLSFSGQDLVHTKTCVNVEQYLSAYYDYYRDNLDKYKDKISITSYEVNVCKNLTLELLRCIEGKASKLSMPSVEGLEDILGIVNDVDSFLQMYSGNKTKFFAIIRNFLADNHSTPYRDHCLSTLLQNYVSYILYFEFDEIHHLVNYFKDTPLMCKRIINHVFADTIFIQKIMRQNHIEITDYTNVAEFFGEEARGFVNLL